MEKAIFERQCSLIIVDEAHRALAPTYKAVLDFLAGPRRPRLVGLTATPGRVATLDAPDNRDLVDLFGGADARITLQDENGQNLINPVSYLQSEGFLAKAKRVPLPSHTSLSTAAELRYFRDTGYIPKSLDRLGGDSTQNKVIFEEIKRLVSAGRKIIVFACSVDQVCLLTMVLVLGIDARCIEKQTSAF